MPPKRAVTSEIFKTETFSFVSNSAALFCELFPSRVRYSGCALSYNLGNAVIGSMIPALLAMIHLHMPALIYLCVPVYMASMVGLLVFFRVMPVGIKE